MNAHEQQNLALLRSVFNSIPSLVFVVDEDVRIQEFNTAASALLGDEPETVLNRRGGEALYCLHSIDSPEGCGTGPSCRDCVVRNSVSEACEGGHVVRRRTKLELVRDGSTVEIYSLISASPFEFEGKKLVLLIVEDISELAELQRLIPICSVCKKVRNDKDYWDQIESYLKRWLDVDFSHGLCPDCLEKALQEISELDAGDS